jgi:hypothetical protein
MMFFFILFGILFTALVWTIQRQSLRWPLRLPICIIILFSCILTIYFYIPEKTLGDLFWYDQRPYNEIILFVMMLFGMAARYITKSIEQRRKEIVKLKKSGRKFDKPGLEFDMWEFSYPLFISVITFGTLLPQIDNTRLTLTNAILGFQTGFFWQTLLTKKIDCS